MSLEEDRREDGLWATGKSAFWLRPDRHLHDMPCWMIPEDAPLVRAPKRIWDANRQLWVLFNEDGRCVGYRVES